MVENKTRVPVMTKTPKIFLVVSITTFTLSFAPVFRDIGWGALRPVGAVAFILFFITNLVAKEMALFDQENSHLLESHPPTRRAETTATESVLAR